MTRRVPFAALGLVAGFAGSFLGIGGGMVIVPVLVLLLGFPLKRAIGTALVTIVPVAIVAVSTEAFVRGSNIHWRAALILTVGSLAGSWLGGRVLHVLPEQPLRIAYAAFMVIACWRMFASTSAVEGAGPISPVTAPVLSVMVMIAAGALGGLSSVLFGIGGGIVLVPALSLLIADFPFHAARATSLAAVVPTSSYSALQHRRLATIDSAAAWGMAPFAVAGAVLGVVSVNRLPARPCRIAFALFLLVAAARLVQDLRWGKKR